MDALTFGRLRNFGRVDKCLLLLSIISSAVYLASRWVQPFPGSVALKALSIAPLAVLAFRVLGTTGSRPNGVESRNTRDNLILAAALALSCLGDIFLHLDPRRYFRHALGAYLIWPTYYLGQYGIAIGFLREKAGDDSQGMRA